MRDTQGNVLKEGHKCVLDTAQLGGLGAAHCHISKIPSILAGDPNKVQFVTVFLTIHLPLAPGQDVMPVLTKIDCAENKAMDNPKPDEPPTPEAPKQEEKSPLAI